MLRRWLIVSALSAFVLTSCFIPRTSAQASKGETQEQELRPEALQLPDDPGSGFVVMDEGLWTALSEQPQQEFQEPESQATNPSGREW